VIEFTFVFVEEVPEMVVIQLECSTNWAIGVIIIALFIHMVDNVLCFSIITHNLCSMLE
jgi:hypothetical protein